MDDFRKKKTKSRVRPELLKFANEKSVPHAYIVKEVFALLRKDDIGLQHSLVRFCLDHFQNFVRRVVIEMRMPFRISKLGKIEPNVKRIMYKDLSRNMGVVEKYFMNKRWRTKQDIRQAKIVEEKYNEWKREQQNNVDSDQG